MKKKKVIPAIVTRCLFLALTACLICLPASGYTGESTRVIPPGDMPAPGTLPAVTMGERGVDAESWIASFAVYLEQCGVERGKELSANLAEAGFRPRAYLENEYMYRSARLENLEVFLEIRGYDSPEVVAFVVTPTPELGDMPAGQRERALSDFAIVMRACVFANIGQLGEAENEPQEDVVDALCPGGLEAMVQTGGDVEADFLRTGPGAKITEAYWLRYEADMEFLTFGCSFAEKEGDNRQPDTHQKLITQIDEYFTMPKEKIIDTLGPNYEVVYAGPEGVCEGYFYEELGMTFAFYPDSDTLDSIDCDPNFKIQGVGIGSLFSEILEALGDAEIVETWIELPSNEAFMLRYSLGNCEYSFIAFEKDAPVDMLWIHQTPSVPASEALMDTLLYEGKETGIVRDVALTQDGILLVGASEYMLDPWVVFIDRNGKELWTYANELDDAYLSPSPLSNGGFSILLKRTAAGGDLSESALLILDKHGNAVSEIPLSANPRSLLAGTYSFFALGEYPGESPEENSGSGNAQPFFEWLSSQGDLLFSYQYPNPEYSSWLFEKGVISGNSIIVSGEARTKSPDINIGVLCQIGMDGTMLRMIHCTPDIGESAYVNDFCVTDDGLILMICTELIYSEEDDCPDRMCSVFCLNMDGEVLWEHKLEGFAMADYIVPVAGGYLCASRGLDLGNCPFIGDGWLLLLDREGNVKAADSTPDIGGGHFELLGMAKDVSGEVLLYGTLLNEPGFPGAPFVARLSFPEAYQ